jgi:hypothetical protein
MRRPGSAKHAKIYSEKNSVSVVMLGIVEGNTLLPMLKGQDKFPEAKTSPSYKVAPGGTLGLGCWARERFTQFPHSLPSARTT